MDTTKTVWSVIEIYDFEQKLVTYAELKSPITSIPASWNSSVSTTPYDIYWNGSDLNGNYVGPGKYFTKLSFLDNRTGKDTCFCGELVIAPRDNADSLR
jgi:hypothetical protein